MKKCLILFLAFISVLFITPVRILAQENIINIDDTSNLQINSPSAILIEYSTGNILYQKNANEKMYPASMTKMMAIYLFLEATKSENYHFEDIVTVSQLASSMGGSQIFLKEGEQMSFEDLFKAVTIASANDATVALAEYTYGTIDNFIVMMNTKAKLFGMENTNFVNATGFHDSNHYTTAFDMSLLANKLLKDYKDILLKYTSIYDTYLRQDTSSPFWLVNTNRMLKYYTGMDGLKTGYTSDSGFNLTATALRNNLRLISVVMGGETSTSRNDDTASLLDYGFNSYKTITLYKSGETLTNIDFNNAKSKQDSIISHEDINIVVKKDISINDLSITIDLNDINAPKTKDEEVGTITIKDKNNNTLATYNIYPYNDIEKLSFLDLLLKYFRYLL
jgi:D-alanyl-D-alanine carboxypeptidase (penicillin-binding protein 5/6)